MRPHSKPVARPRRIFSVALSAVLGAALIGVPTAASAAPFSAVPASTAVTTSVAPRVTVTRKLVTGDIVVTKAGTVIDAVDVHGRIIVRAENVVIKNSIVRGLDSGSPNGLIEAVQGKPGLKVIDTEIVGSARSLYANGVMGYNFELLRVTIHDVVDQVRITGSNVKVTDSKLYGNRHYDNDASRGGGPTHDDNVQIQGGSNIVLSGNTMSSSHNAAVQVTQGLSVVSNVTIASNRIDNGACAINIAQNPRGPLAGITIKNNVFGNTMKFKGCAVVSPPTTKLILSGNTFTTGAAITVTPRVQ